MTKTLSTPTLTLVQDTGASASDGITRNRSVLVGGLDAGSVWQYQVDGGNWVDGGTNLRALTADMISGTFNGGWLGSDLAVTKVVNLSSAGGSTRTAWLMNWDGSYTRGVKVEFSQDKDGRLQVRVLGCMESLDSDRSGSGTDFALRPPATSDGDERYGLKSLSIKGTQVSSGYLGTGVTLLNQAFLLSDAQHTYAVRQSDPTGSFATSAVATYTLDNGAAAPTLSLASDTGSLQGDGVTRVKTVTVDGLESGASWVYSLDGGRNWRTGVGNSFELTDSNAVASLSFAAGAVQVRQTDRAGNVSTIDASSHAWVISRTNGCLRNARHQTGPARGWL